MKQTELAATFYNKVLENNLSSFVEQWGSLASCAQYRLPYTKTLHYVPKGSLCLDWGCGNGHFAYFLTQSGFTTQGYSFEAIPRFLARQPTFSHTQGQTSDPFSLPYNSASFDAVFSMGVLEHVHERGGDQARSLREIERLLKPGGLFLIFHLPNSNSWIEFLVRTIKRSANTQKHAHSKLFSRKSFEQLLYGTSFEIIESGRYNSIPRNSLNRLPKAVANQRWLCRALDAIDDLLSQIFPAITQNWYFILKKKS